MTKEQIKQMAEDMIEWQCFESGLSREEVIDPSAYSFCEWYFKDEITRQDLIDLTDYLDFPLNIEEVDKMKERRVKRRLARKRRSEQKKLERANKNKK